MNKQGLFRHSAHPRQLHMVTGREVTDSEKTQTSVDGGNNATVDEIPYLGAVPQLMCMEKKIARASQSFGAFRKTAFLDKNLKMETKRRIYQICISSLFCCMAQNYQLRAAIQQL